MGLSVVAGRREGGVVRAGHRRRAGAATVCGEVAAVANIVLTETEADKDACPARINTVATAAPRPLNCACAADNTCWCRPWAQSRGRRGRRRWRRQCRRGGRTARASAAPTSAPPTWTMRALAPRRLRRWCNLTPWRWPAWARAGRGGRGACNVTTTIAAGADQRHRRPAPVGQPGPPRSTWFAVSPGRASGVAGVSENVTVAVVSSTTRAGVEDHRRGGAATLDAKRRTTEVAAGVPAGT